jgi:putative transposase
MIKSSKTSILFANRNKLLNVNSFIQSYREAVSFFSDVLWDSEKIPTLPEKVITSQLTSSLSERAKQAAAKQAAAIVRGTKAKQARRLWQINQFKSKGMHKKARRLQAIYDKNIVSKPKIDNVNPELDSRFVKIDLNNSSSFDGWLTLSSLGSKLKIQIPFKKTKHFNDMLSRGALKSGIRLSQKSITFMFEIQDKSPIASGSTLGIDIGQNSIISCSNGQQINKDNHGHNYKSICQKLSRKRKGSKAFERCQRHRSNYVSWAIKRINLTGVKVVRRENIKNMKRGRKLSRSLSHWCYAEIFAKLDERLNDSGVQIVKVNPVYTSQRCSACGWVRKGNRKGLQFKCLSCSYEDDSDLNAAKNIAFELEAISLKQRLSGLNRRGFYLERIAAEDIVPQTQKK